MDTKSFGIFEQDVGGTLYIGVNVGTSESVTEHKTIMSYMNEAQKRIWIFSPFVTPEYIDKLMEFVDKEIDVRLITNCNEKLRKSDRLKNSMTIDKEKEESAYRYSYYKLSAELDSKISLLKAKWWKGSNQKVKEDNIDSCFSAKCHAKIYLIDDFVIIGSANFTKYSFTSNLETTFVIRNKSVVRQVCDFFEQMKTNEDFITPFVEERCYINSAEKLLSEIGKLTSDEWNRIQPFLIEQVKKATNPEYAKYDSLKDVMDNLLILSPEVLNPIKAMIQTAAQFELEKKETAV